MSLVMSIVVSLIMAIVALAIAQPAAAQNLHYGMNTRVLTPQMADKTAELGAGVIRLAYGWDVIEPSCKGCFNWTTTDAWRDEAKRTGRIIFASLAYAPAWANGGHPFNYPPLVYQDWYDFVFAVVSRYRDDIFLWGIWNEPNLDVYMHGTSIDVYTNLAITGRAAIRAANPRAIVLGPDISWHATQNGWFSSAMRATAALLDIVTVHWYADGPKLDVMMDDLVRPFTYGKEVWLAETGMKPCASFFGEVGQALFYRQVLEAFDRRRSWWTGVLFYDLYDPPMRDDCGSAITRSDWSNRPAFAMLQAFIKAHP
jgi:Glycosyl hydrolase catalytic core